MIGAGSALVVLLASPAHDSGAVLTFGGDFAKAAANDKGNGKGSGNDKGNSGGKGGGKGDGKGGGKGGGGGNGGNAGNGNGSSGGNAGGSAAGNQGGQSESSGSAGGAGVGTGTGGTPSAGGTAVPSASRDAAIVKIKAYREAVLDNDLKAAAAALASVKSEITAREIGHINEILGLNSQTTTLTPEDIVRGVREIASRRP